MYNTQQIADLIDSVMKTKHIQKKIMLADLNFGINTLSQFSKGRELSCLSLGKIADYLDVSVDYLLGRTENSESHKI